MPNKDSNLEKESRLLAVTNHPHFEPSLKLVQLGVGIMTLLAVLSGFLIWFAGFPYWLWIPSGVLVFFLFALGWYLVVLRPKNKRLEAEIRALKDIENERPLILATAENNLLKGELEKLEAAYENEGVRFQSLYEEKEALEKSHVDEIEKIQKDHENRVSHLFEAKETLREEAIAENQSLREAHKEELENLKEDFAYRSMQTKKIFDAELLQRDVLLDRISFVLEPERQQKENISSKVSVEQIAYSDRDFEWRDTPWIMFVLRIRNYSMFDITFENSVSGVLSFRKKVLNEEKKFEKEPPIIPAFGGFDHVRVIQFLNQLDVDTLKIAMEKRKNRVGNISLIQFDFSKLILTITGSRKFPQVKSRPLDLTGEAGRIEDRDL